MQGGSQKKVRFRFFPPAFPVDREPPDLVLQAPLVRRPGEFVAGCGPETLVARREEGSQGFSLGTKDSIMRRLRSRSPSVSLRSIPGEPGRNSWTAILSVPGSAW